LFTSTRLHQNTAGLNNQGLKRREKAINKSNYLSVAKSPIPKQKAAPIVCLTIDLGDQSSKPL
jgi:hypothetical protein